MGNTTGTEEAAIFGSFPGDRKSLIRQLHYAEDACVPTNNVLVLNDSEDDGGLVIEEPRVSSLEERKLLLKLLIAARDCSAKTSTQRAADYLSEIAFTYIVNAGGRSHWANVEEAWRQIDKREVLPEPLLHDYQLSNLEQNMKKLFRVRGPCALAWIYCVRLRNFYVCRQS
jgi:hypothetical protein